MPYEPNTKHVAPDEQLDLPRGAIGVSVERGRHRYAVHYLVPTEDKREAAREEVRRILDTLPAGEENTEIRNERKEAAAEKRRERSLGYSSSDTSEPSQ